MQYQVNNIRRREGERGWLFETYNIRCAVFHFKSNFTGIGWKEQTVLLNRIELYPVESAVVLNVLECFLCPNQALEEHWETVAYRDRQH